jgi:hypothetical protein
MLISFLFPLCSFFSPVLIYFLCCPNLQALDVPHDLELFVGRVCAPEEEVDEGFLVVQAAQIAGDKWLGQRLVRNVAVLPHCVQRSLGILPHGLLLRLHQLACKTNEQSKNKNKDKDEGGERKQRAEKQTSLGQRASVATHDDDEEEEKTSKRRQAKKR